MTQQELLYLEKGRIPARIVLDEIRAYLSKHEAEEIEGGLIAGIARKGQVSSDTIYTWLGQDRVQSIDFDTADKILLYLLGPDAWRNEYAEYYYGVNLNVKKCGCPGCETMIEVVSARPTGGGVVREYCSQTCRQVAYRIRKGTHKPRREKQHLTGKRAKCRRGHPRTPDNIKQRADGRIECMVCARERMREYRAAEKQAA